MLDLLPLSRARPPTKEARLKRPQSRSKAKSNTTNGRSRKKKMIAATRIGRPNDDRPAFPVTKKIT